MNKTTSKNFMAWLETASNEVIYAKKAEFIEALEKISSREAKADLRLGLRLIDEDLLARLELGRLGSRPS